MRRKEVPCVLCEKEATRSDSGVCSDCVYAWQVGTRKIKLFADEKELARAQVEWYPHMSAHQGSVEGNSDIYWRDIAQAIGAFSVRDSNHGFHDGTQEPIVIGNATHGGTFGTSSREPVLVPKVRALAMQKILAAFFNGVAKAHAEGVTDGSSLLAQLAKGEVTTAEFDEHREAAKMQRKRRRGR